jgi:hypothetical protein
MINNVKRITEKTDLHREKKINNPHLRWAGVKNAK